MIIKLKNFAVAMVLAIGAISCTNNKQPIDYVNPMIGTANKGNTFPGAVVPWGMANISPHNSRSKLWSGSRYFYGETYLYGFGQIHLSGVGCADFANINLMPTTGNVYGDYYKNRSRYSDEVAQAGYYKTTLNKSGIVVETSATERTTISKYTFPACADDANILLDVTEGLTLSKDAFVEISEDLTEIRGFNKAGGFCNEKNEYTIYFVAQVSKPAIKAGTWNYRTLKPNNLTEEGKNLGAYLSFSTEENEEILVKVGLSYVSIENARLNLEEEQPGWNFESVKASAKEKWNSVLSKIEVETKNEIDKEKFYTALYHCLIHPNIINDVNGEYPSMGSKKIAKVPEGHNQYTVYSLWDTYRTLHPLLTLVYPQQQTDMLRTMVDHAAKNGLLTFWELGADETFVMNGDPAPIVLADSYIKGLQNFDVELAYKTMIQTALDTGENLIRPMQKYFSRYGYIPYDDCGPNDVWGKPRMVSECQEYAYADWAIAQFGKALGKEDSVLHYLEERSLAYKHYFDKEIGFLRPKYKDGSWFEPFTPESYLGSWKNPGFVEGNSWHYSFFVPHDIKGLINLQGGNDGFTQKLQQCFDEDNFTVDNEPDIAYPYLFNYVPGEEWRCQKIIRHLMDYDFTTGPSGLPGNDDAGTISAWYVFSAMGIYPDCPGNTKYQLGSGIFDKVTIHLDTGYWEGNSFIIENLNNSSDNKYLQSASFNNQKVTKPYILHEDISKGGALNIKFGSNPNQKIFW